MVGAIDKIEIWDPERFARVLDETGEDFGDRLAGIFLRDKTDRRPLYGGSEKFQTDPHWRDHILFYEYFHADNGQGLGASHQTGWTGLVAWMLMPRKPRG